MRILLGAAAVVAGAAFLTLSAPANAQLSTSGGRPALGIPLQSDTKKSTDPEAETHDKEYKSAIEKIPNKQKPNSDPWSGMRSNATTQNQKNAR